MTEDRNYIATKVDGYLTEVEQPDNLIEVKEPGVYYIEASEVLESRQNTQYILFATYGLIIGALLSWAVQMYR